MDTLCKDLLYLIFNVSNNYRIVVPFTQLYGDDFLKIKYKQTVKHIDLKLQEIFGEERYEIFTESSVLTGSFLLLSILQDTWKYDDIDIISSNPNFEVKRRIQSNYDQYNLYDHWEYGTEQYQFGTVDNHLLNKIKMLLKISNLMKYTQYNGEIINIITIDLNKTTIKEHIEHGDYDFLKNYAYYENKKLQLFVYDYLSVFNKKCAFNPSIVIWRSPERYSKYTTCRGFEITWNPLDLISKINKYIQTVHDIFGNKTNRFLVEISSGTSRNPFLDDLLKIKDRDDIPTLLVKATLTAFLLKTLIEIDTESKDKMKVVEVETDIEDNQNPNLDPQWDDLD